MSTKRGNRSLIVVWFRFSFSTIYALPAARSSVNESEAPSEF